MSAAWVILDKRYGSDVSQPSDEDLAQAIDEVFNENIDGMTEADYAEHPSASLRYGFDQGPMFVADVGRNKTVILSKFADLDYDELLAEGTVDVDRATALKLWRWLSEGRIEEIRSAYPSCGW